LAGSGVLQLYHPFLSLGDIKTEPLKLDTNRIRKAILVAMVSYEN